MKEYYCIFQKLSLRGLFGGMTPDLTCSAVITPYLGSNQELLSFKVQLAGSKGAIIPSCLHYMLEYLSKGNNKLDDMKRFISTGIQNGRREGALIAKYQSACFASQFFFFFPC